MLERRYPIFANLSVFVVRNYNWLKFGYNKYEHTAGLFEHISRATTFAFVVDDFGIKYYSKDDALHLLTYLYSLYEITTDWIGSLYTRLTLL